MEPWRELLARSLKRPAEIHNAGVAAAPNPRASSLWPYDRPRDKVRRMPKETRTRHSSMANRCKCASQVTRLRPPRSRDKEPEIQAGKAALSNNAAVTRDAFLENCWRGDAPWANCWAYR